MTDPKDDEDYVILLEELSDTKKELQEYKSFFLKMCQKLEDGTLHAVYCNENHNERVGAQGMICNCTLGIEIKRLRRERDEALKKVEELSKK